MVRELVVTCELVLVGWLSVVVGGGITGIGPRVMLDVLDLARNRLVGDVLVDLAALVTLAIVAFVTFLALLTPSGVMICCVVYFRCLVCFD